ncbi:post-transcriptional regulator [Paenibacillus sp. MMS20-IR301]|uniref:post-transcriptional regulator n=1 Tax=Paenibacillus sp. MMS20-IR301 TaxID=2895946 RepID=UPI0028E3EDC8|nr:post-transcriptional regulator [Paenibacillus sp. MMS20-IR301]WNS43651.1 post-transcriptional regulator [Paenibacillus sp. MMS20-IR301]
MESEHWNYGALSEEIEAMCISKAEEFRLLGYEYVSGKDIWDCVSRNYDKEGVPPLHKLVNDIYSLKSSSYMNYLTIAAYRGYT